ncbi:phosphotransferase family protein [Aspergillus homomorphus CBS 101889]|uniref:Aminoglycoside phosphotransferase domain-containing protein n=1 Tax=Aspergillus homomorphus (strain CBS 101889) TaxID=1450537 RepID=A0A395HQF0_ASPHC|nr:hypothetical protein BO97DRAFT_456769 [Aspergillus homomorphus CBS 101889]RAL10172.1 hypothetical protein BO97DRAFT_456769 [Aspergillus homomorphus CBS 101889]
MLYWKISSRLIQQCCLKQVRARDKSPILLSLTLAAIVHSTYILVRPVAWVPSKSRQNESLKKEWVTLFSTSSQGICELASRYRGRDDCLYRSMHCGSFNFSIRLHWDDGGPEWLIRFPISGKSMILDEKVENEAVLMKYIAKKKQIPVPRIVAYGRAADNPTGLGPFIIMTWVEGKKMSDALRRGGGTPEKEEALDPHIDLQTLKTLYGEMADILLELWSLDFDSIGSLHEDKKSPQRPLRAPTWKGSGTVSAIRMTVGRTDNYGPFKLFCDDLCPGNVLVDDSLNVTGAIDWEFCYAAPAQFAGKCFLQALELRDEAKGLDMEVDRLSVRMRESIKTKSAWFYLACRSVTSVYLLYWDLLDEHCWGERSSIAEMVRSFTSNNRLHKGREEFVRSKIVQLQDYSAELGEETDVVYEEEEEQHRAECENDYVDVSIPPEKANLSSSPSDSPDFLETWGFGGKDTKQLATAAAVTCLFIVGLAWRRLRA